MWKAHGKKYKLGLALSGGGARGFAHLGSVKALSEYGYSYEILSGTSMGAIIGCVLADGYQPDEIISLLSPKNLKNAIKTHISLNGMMTMKGAQKLLEKILHVKNIEDLKIPFIAAATDIQKGKIKYFTEGNIIDAVLASSSIPIVFEPFIINGISYVDGGVLNNLPARAIREQCEKLIGIHVNPQNLGLNSGTVDGITHIAERTFYLAMKGNVIHDQALCDIFIEHSNLENYGIFEFTKMEEISEIGYKNTKKELNKINLTIKKGGF